MSKLTGRGGKRPKTPHNESAAAPVRKNIQNTSNTCKRKLCKNIDTQINSLVVCV